MNWVRIEPPSVLFKELLRRFRWGVDLAIDEHAASIWPAGAFEFPCDFVALARQSLPFGGFGGILFEPEMLVSIGK